MELYIIFYQIYILFMHDNLYQIQNYYIILFYLNTSYVFTYLVLLYHIIIINYYIMY